MKKARLSLPALFMFFSTIFMVSCGNQADTAETSESTQSTADTLSVTEDWKLGVQLWTFHNFPFVTALEKADSAGIKYIEAFPGQPMGGDFKDTFNYTMGADSRKKVKDLLSGKGISLVAFGVVVPQTPEEWRKVFEFAKDMGIRYITAEPLRNHLDTVNTMAGEYGVMVAIHNHPKPSPYDYPDSVLTAINGRINLGACVDVGHLTRNGVEVVPALKSMEGRIMGIHLKDIDAANKVDAGDVILGKGVVPLPEIFAELRRQKFSGMFSIEHEANWDNNVPDVIQDREFFEKQIAVNK